MRKNIINASLALASVLFLSACGGSNSTGVAKVNEVDYPQGISVSIYDGKIREGVAISNARISFGKNKRQAQFVINNTSDDIYNLLVNSQWTDKRGMVVSAYPRPQRLTLQPKSGKRMRIDAPNFKAQDIAIHVECANNCVVEK
ncbi:DUF1425 domain-containing protein [Sulfurimonas sp. SAG-AH-194-I05]|nr:hypothetical protein [Sulfurimonas sp. SAG-AH-194-I05]MDF1875244.1 DUF1425 domain-containing protein [Sulfurimonas sp. SAG-AH-194-I05]